MRSSTSLVCVCVALLVVNNRALALPNAKEARDHPHGHHSHHSLHPHPHHPSALTLTVQIESTTTSTLTTTTTTTLRSTIAAAASNFVPIQSQLAAKPSRRAVEPKRRLQGRPQSDEPTPAPTLETTPEPSAEPTPDSTSDITTTTTLSTLYTTSTTVTTTATATAVVVTGPPVYAQCGSENFASQVNGQFVDSLSGDNTQSEKVAAATSKEECCQACQDATANGGCIAFIYKEPLPPSSATAQAGPGGAFASASGGGSSSTSSATRKRALADGCMLLYQNGNETCPAPYTLNTVPSAPLQLATAGNGKCGAVKVSSS